MKYPKSIEAALQGIMDGATSDMPAVSNGVGRPSTKRIVNGIVLDREEYDVYVALVEFWDTARKITESDLMTDEQFVAFMKSAAPKLQARMINMAMVSDDLKAVRAVAADLADRGYGKAASQININVGVKDIRNAWKEIEGREIIDMGKLPVIEAGMGEDNGDSTN